METKFILGKWYEVKNRRGRVIGAWVVQKMRHGKIIYSWKAETYNKKGEIVWDLDGRGIDYSKPEEAKEAAIEMVKNPD